MILNVEAVAYHEGIPGHHLQFSIAQEEADLPDFRRFAYYNAYSEGWAFYAERLGIREYTPNIGRASRCWIISASTRPWMSPPLERR